MFVIRGELMRDGNQGPNGAVRRVLGSTRLHTARQDHTAPSLPLAPFSRSGGGSEILGSSWKGAPLSLVRRASQSPASYSYLNSFNVIARSAAASRTPCCVSSMISGQRDALRHRLPAGEAGAACARTTRLRFSRLESLCGLLMRAARPIALQLPAKRVPSAETSAAPCQTWRSPPNPGLRPRTHEIPLLTFGGSCLNRP